MGTIGAEIMIVDDEPKILKLLGDYLELKKISSTSFKSAEEALAFLMKSSSLGIKLVLLDILMPEMNGLEMLKRIKKIRPKLPVIMVTGQSDLEVAKECLNAGAKDYIAKPIDFDYLETSILAEMLTLM